MCSSHNTSLFEAQTCRAYHSSSSHTNENALPLGTNATETAARTLEGMMMSVDKPSGSCSGNFGTLSGLRDNEYETYFRQLGEVTMGSLPPELVEHFGHMTVNCSMGLFPQVSRAWLTIDSDIYVWKFENCGDLAYFDGLSDTILSVALLHPKRGIFQEHIQYLLCLTTAVEIVLLGVSFLQGSQYEDEMHLLPEPLYTLPTDATYMMTVISTSLGRIFMGGKDGYLYEFAYFADNSGWFGKKAQKINHSTSSFSFLLPNFMSWSEEDSLVQLVVDDTRNILYTRSEKGSLHVFDLGSDGLATKSIVVLSQHNLVQEAMKFAINIDKSNFYPIIHIASVTVSESSNLTLVAVSKCGVRFYFSTGVTRSDERPSSLVLQHVRLPPGFTASSTIQKPNKAHMCYYKNGTMLLSCSQNDNDILYLLSSEGGNSSQTIFTENQSVIRLDGHVWALDEIPQQNSICHLYESSFGLTVSPPLLAVQHVLPPRRFVLLSAKGTHIVSQIRPVDQLRGLLLDNEVSGSPGDAGGGDAIKNFFNSHGEMQACATALILATSNSSDFRVSELATRAFFLYGGEPRFVHPTSSHSNQSSFSPFSSPNFSPHIASTPMALASSGPSHSLSEQGINNLNREIVYSGKHNGLYLYFTRIIRPLWCSTLAYSSLTSSSSSESQRLESSLASNELEFIIEQCRQLKGFMEKNGGFASGSFMENCPQEALLRERRSLMCLQQLVSQTIQVLGLVKVISDHDFSSVLSLTLTLEEQNSLKGLLYRDLILSGRDICTRLVEALIQRYLSDNASTDGISSQLRSICPSLYNNDDTLSSKAHEIILASKSVGNLTDRLKMLNESLVLCKEIAGSLNLSVIVSHYNSLQFFRGVVDVCLCAASKRDPQGLAYHFYKNNEPSEDTQGYTAFMTRMNCYKHITDMLAKLYSVGSGVSSGIPRVPGPPPEMDPNAILPEEASAHVENVLDHCLSSEDALFHAALYQWLVDEKHYEKLLEIKSPFLEDYLNRGMSQHPESLLMSDLLWKHYEKTKSYGAAAKILAKLADKHSTDITLKERLEYLSRAIMCVKSGEMGGGVEFGSASQLLHDLEEKMEVARVQLQILDSLSHLIRQRPDVNSVISRLNTDLLDISTLYQDFAEPYGLWECQLSILHCAGHSDQMLIENMWDHIIEQETLNESSDNIVLLSNRLVSLGKMYASSQKYFPLEHIIYKLEIYSCRLKAEHSWVFNTMCNVGTSLPKLLNVYNKLFLANYPIWIKLSSPNHLLIVLSKLFKKFVESPSIVSMNERRAFIVSCQDAVVIYLGQLYVKPDSCSENLVKEFRAIESKLERL